MVLQAFIDDSSTPNGAYVLAGYLATAENWAKLAQDWERMLPHAVWAGGRHRFKMSEMMSNEERAKRVPGFCKIVEDNVVAALSVKSTFRDIKNGSERISIPAYESHWREIADHSPFHYMFRFFLEILERNLHRISDFLPEEPRIDFVFDHQSEKSEIISAWDFYTKNAPEQFRRHMGTVPRFEHDDEYLPLQAADMYAWHVRELYESGATHHDIGAAPFGPIEKTRLGFPTVTIEFGEDDVADFLVDLAQEIFGHQATIVDWKYGDATWR